MEEYQKKRADGVLSPTSTRLPQSTDLTSQEITRAKPNRHGEKPFGISYHVIIPKDEKELAKLIEGFSKEDQEIILDELARFNLQSKDGYG